MSATEWFILRIFATTMVLIDIQPEGILTVIVTAFVVMVVLDLIRWGGHQFEKRVSQ